jgi:hypothetical protein
MTILWGSLADSSWICRKHENDEKVTGFARDDKKERVVAGKGQLPDGTVVAEQRHLSI